LIEGWLAVLSESIRSGGSLAPLLALLAGAITSVTPCALTSIPLIIAYVGGTRQNDPRRGFALSLVFSVGMASTFTALGAAASLFGRLAGTSSRWWTLGLGILMLLMALQIWGIFDFVPSANLLSRSTRRGYAGAFLAGILGGFFSSPCATPVLVVLLGFVAREGNLVSGIFLLLLYSLGHSILVVAAGTSTSFAAKLASSGRVGRFGTVLKLFLGAGLMLLSFALFYQAF
jgi:cytochrome c-type biogenesis protein